MNDESSGRRQELQSEALQHLLSAIELLDASEAPANIAAHIDLAIHQLQDELAKVSGDGVSPQRSSITSDPQKP